MKPTHNQFHFWFLSLLTAIMIVLTNTAAKANTSPQHSKLSEQQMTFPFDEYEAAYNIKFMGVSAGQSVHRLIERADGLFHFESKTAPSLDWLPYRYYESTDFSWDEKGIKPQNYFYEIREGKRYKKGNVAFDWEKGILANEASKEPWETEIPENVQDKLTQSLRLRYDLMRNKSNLIYAVAEDDELKTYSYRILGEEEVTTPMGTFIALKVQHIHRKGYRTNTWFAKKLDYFPIKVNQIRKGRIVGQGEITDLKWLTNEKVKNSIENG